MNIPLTDLHFQPHLRLIERDLAAWVLNDTPNKPKRNECKARPALFAAVLRAFSHITIKSYKNFITAPVFVVAGDVLPPRSPQNFRPPTSQDPPEDA